MYHDEIKAEFDQATKVLKTFLANEKNIASIEQAAIMIARSFKKGGKVLSCGNGGSHCDAVHFAEELTGRYRENRSAYPAIAISDVGHLSCVGNDFGYDQVFSRYIEAIGNQGDILVAISTSGHSVNIIRAIRSAKEKRMAVIGLTGHDGGELKDLVDINLCVPHSGYADRIQEMHIKIIHIVIMLVEKEMQR